MIKAEYVDTLEKASVWDYEILEAKVLGVDTETTGLDPLVDKVRLLQIAFGERVVIFDLFKINLNSLTAVKAAFADPKKIKVFQNAKFDLKFLQLPIENIFDTYLASILISCGEEKNVRGERLRHSLDVLCEDFLGIKLDKELQRSSFESNLSEDQIIYAARDAWVLIPLMEKQKKFLKTLNLERVALLEFETVKSVASMELNGFYLNQDTWLTRIKDQEEKLVVLESNVKNHFKEVVPSNIFGELDLDINSPLKLVEALKKLGIPVENTAEWGIKPLASKYPVIDSILKYREVSTALNKFGKNYLEHVHPLDGRIHADFKQLGANTGRFTCSNPNLQQVPQKDLYRNSFQAPEGFTLIVADYSMIELRIMAQFSRDPKLLEAFNRGIDLHQFTGANVYGKPLEEAAKGTRLRNIGKGLNFATTYGAGPATFAASSGLSLKESEEALSRFWNLYGGLEKYLRESGERAVKELESHTYSGRTWRFEVDISDQKSVGAVERLGKNFPIQGTSADIIKRAMCFLENEMIVNVVHDELVVECVEEDAEMVKEIVENEMKRAAEEVITELPVVVDAEITKVWKK